MSATRRARESVPITTRRGGAIFAAAFIVCCSSSFAIAAGDPPARFTATYGVALRGVPLGEFHLDAATNADRYDLSVHAKFSVFAGWLYEASGRSSSVGRRLYGEVLPDRFSLSYKAGSKFGKRVVAFQTRSVSRIKVRPSKGQTAHRLPLTEEHLRNVLDPLTATFMTPTFDGKDTEICNRVIPVFDGKLRFDVRLTPKTAQNVERRIFEGLAGPFIVCGARFVPVAGHRPDNKRLVALAKEEGISVWLVKLPQAAIYLPYRIEFPTPLGLGSAEIKSFSVNRSGSGPR